MFGDGQAEGVACGDAPGGQDVQVGGAAGGQDRGRGALRG